MHVNELYDPERTTSLVKQYIPAAKLSAQHENELSYILPLENVDKFPGNYRLEYVNDIIAIIFECAINGDVPQNVTLGCKYNKKDLHKAVMEIGNANLELRSKHLSFFLPVM